MFDVENAGKMKYNISSNCNTGMLEIFKDLEVKHSRFRYEPGYEKTNNVVSEHDRHKLSCTSTEDG